MVSEKSLRLPPVTMEDFTAAKTWETVVNARVAAGEYPFRVTSEIYFDQLGQVPPAGGLPKLARELLRDFWGEYARGGFQVGEAFCHCLGLPKFATFAETVGGEFYFCGYLHTDEHARQAENIRAFEKIAKAQRSAGDAGKLAAACAELPEIPETAEPETVAAHVFTPDEVQRAAIRGGNKSWSGWEKPEGFGGLRDMAKHFGASAPYDGQHKVKQEGGRVFFGFPNPFEGNAVTHWQDATRYCWDTFPEFRASLRLEA